MISQKKIFHILIISILLIFTIVLSSCASKPPEKAPELAQSATDSGNATFPTIPPAASVQAEPNVLNQASQPLVPQEINRWGKGRINGVGYLSNSKLLAVGTTLGIYIYDTASWDELRFMDACPSGLYSMAVIPKGDTIAAGCSNGLVQLWQASDGTMLKELKGHTDKVSALSFSADGQSLITGSTDYSLRIWKVADGSQVKAIEDKISSYIYAVALTSDGTTMAIGLDESEEQLLLWKLDANEPYLVSSDHFGPISDVVFSADNATLASSSRDGKIILWDVAKGTVIKTLATESLPEMQIPTPTVDPNETKSPEEEEKLAIIETAKNPFVFNIAFSPDGQSIAAGYFDNVVRIWKIADGSLSQTLKGHESLVFNIAYSADGQQLVSRSIDGTTRIWQVSDGSNIKTLEFSSSVSTISYSPDGTKIIMGGELNIAQLRQVSDGSDVYKLLNFTSPITSTAFSSDGTKIVVGSIDGTAKVYQASDGNTLFIISPDGPVLSVAFSPDNQFVAAGSGISNRIDIWDGNEATEIKTLKGHIDYIYSLNYSADGTLLASGSKDTKVILWFAKDAKQIGTFSGHLGNVTSVAFSPNGETLASGSIDLSIRLWKVPSGEAIRTIQLPAPITSLAYSQDGSLLVAGLLDGAVVLLPIQAENPDTPLATLKGHKDVVTAVKFSPDQTTLTTASRDGTVRFWRLK